MDRDADSLLDVAIAQHEAGHLDLAEQSYRAVLAIDPEQPDALNLLGLILHDRGQTHDAIALLDRALAVDPDFPEALTNLARCRRTTGDAEAAARLAQRAIDTDPALPEAALQLGLALYDLKRFDAALPHLDRAATLLPGLPDATFALANARMALNDLPGAISDFQQVLRIKPDTIDAMLNLSMCLLTLGRSEEAKACQKKAIAAQPDNPATHAALALTLHHGGDIAGSLAACRRALSLAPNHHDALVLAGTNLIALGQFDEAESCLRRAIEHYPHSAPARAGLASIGKGGETDQDEAQLTTRLGNAATPWYDRATAGFALGSTLDRAGRYDEAFAAYRQANRLVREARSQQGRHFDAAGLRRYVDWAIATFEPAMFDALHERGNPSRKPVFIVGMPRSGTTLVEQIVASHSRVFGAGELRETPQLIAALDEGAGHISPLLWKPGRMRELTARHIDFLGSLEAGADRIVDKLPDNIQALGQIVSLFPNAAIIVCRRDMRDVCLSCYFQNFQDGSEWTFDLEDCVSRAEEIDRLTRHWLTVLPADRVLEVRYEDIVADLEAQSRRLIAFLGLDWEAACLDFQNTQRVVKTASQWQVRQSLYATSLDRWKHYESHLAPYRTRFAALLKDRDTAQRRAAYPAPGSAAYAAAIARAHVVARDFDKAETAAREAMRLDQGTSHGVTAMALVLAATDRQPEALTLLRDEAASRPSDAMLAMALADLLAIMLRWNEAEAAWRTALAILPDDLTILSGLRRALWEQGKYHEAIPIYRRVADLQPDSALARYELSGIYLADQDPATGLEYARRAVEMEPGRAAFHVQVADCLNALGETGEAMAAFRRAVSLDPNDALALGALVRSGHSDDKAADMTRLRDIAHNESASHAMRAAACFALAPTLDKAGDYDEAFAFLAIGNRLMHQDRTARGHIFDRQQTKAFVDGQINTFDPAAMHEIGQYGNQSDVPVFIVGLPRSGTTLVEQILAQHPDIHGLGETKNVYLGVDDIKREAALAGRTSLLPSQIAAKADEILAAMRAPMPTARRVTDKMPDNITIVGQIAMLFPHARVIFCRRDPRDTGLSCYFENFGEAIPWAFDQADIGYNIYQMERLWLHWRHVLPIRMLDVHYKDLVADLEGQARRMLDFLDLPWDPACLAFHQSKRQVVTASVWQVRRPIYTSSVGRWRNYRAHLGPMIAELGELVTDEPALP